MTDEEPKYILNAMNLEVSINRNDGKTELQLFEHHSDAEKLPSPIILSESLKQDAYSKTITEVQCPVRISVPNQRLFIGIMPKIRCKESIRAKFDKLISGITDVTTYNCPDDKQYMNSGFCFLDFESHQAAAKAKRRMETGRVGIWGNEMFVYWADPQEEPDENIIAAISGIDSKTFKEISLSKFQSDKRQLKIMSLKRLESVKAAHNLLRSLCTDELKEILESPRRHQ